MFLGTSQDHTGTLSNVERITIHTTYSVITILRRSGRDFIFQLYIDIFRPIIKEYQLGQNGRSVPFDS